MWRQLLSLQAWTAESCVMCSSCFTLGHMAQQSLHIPDGGSALFPCHAWPCLIRDPLFVWLDFDFCCIRYPTLSHPGFSCQIWVFCCADSSNQLRNVPHFRVNLSTATAASSCSWKLHTQSQGPKVQPIHPIHPFPLIAVGVSDPNCHQVKLLSALDCQEKMQRRHFQKVEVTL